MFHKILKRLNESIEDFDFNPGVKPGRAVGSVGEWRRVLNRSLDDRKIGAYIEDILRYFVDNKYYMIKMDKGTIWELPIVNSSRYKIGKVIALEKKINRTLFSKAKYICEMNDGRYFYAEDIHTVYQTYLVETGNTEPKSIYIELSNLVVGHYKDFVNSVMVEIRDVLDDMKEEYNI